MFMPPPHTTARLAGAAGDATSAAVPFCLRPLVVLTMLALTAPHALAQQAATPAPQDKPAGTAAAADKAAADKAASDKAASDKAGAEGLAQEQNRIVITGSTSLKRTVRESSVAVTVADREDLDRKAPRSTASALELIPGIYVEDSGGEVSNNFSVRGLAGGAQTFIQLQEDGLPVFYTNALSDTILKQELMIDRMEAVRGGTSGILTTNGAGATINFITFRPRGEPEGAIRFTTSDYNTRRVDFRYGGGLGDKWFAGVGGFYRAADSVRDTGFTADKGGIVRAWLGRKIDGGEWSVSLKLVDDHNTFLLPIPLQDPAKPRGIPGMNPNYGTMNGLDSGVQFVRNSPATGTSGQTNDTTDGVHTVAHAIGYSFEKALSDAWQLRSKGRYTDFKNDFNAVFSYDNASLRPAIDRLDPGRNADVAAMLSRFGGTPAVRVVSTGEILRDAAALNALNGNGLVSDNITAKNKRYVREFVNDTSVSWTLPNNSLTIGWLGFDTSVSPDGPVGASRFLSDVRDNARRLDIVAVDAAGKVLGSRTENGILAYQEWGEGNSLANASSNSIYLNDEFKVSDRWRLDAGLRHERYRFSARRTISASQVPIPGAFRPGCDPAVSGEAACDADNVMANNYFANAQTGNHGTVAGGFNENSWTVGTNYLINDNLAIYGRHASSYQANAENPVTKIDFSEIGLRWSSRRLSGTLTAFRTNYKGFRFGRAFDGAEIEATSDIDVKGVELEAMWRPVRWAQLAFTGVVQDSGLSVKGFKVNRNPNNVDVGALEGLAKGWEGNRPERSPKVNFTITPSVSFQDNRGEVYLSYHRVGDRYADIANTLKLPAYHTVDLGLRYDLTESVTLNASVQNLTNTIGLTEGNPRSGFAENPGVSNFYYARPILGRNAQLSVTVRF